MCEQVISGVYSSVSNEQEQLMNCQSLFVVSDWSINSFICFYDISTQES
jgi:hypothetical protein